VKVVERWRDGAGTPEEVRAAQALRAVAGEPGLDELALARLQHRIARALRPARRGFWRWQPVVVALVLGVAGMAAATIGAVVVKRRPPVVTPLPSERGKAHRSRPHGPVIVSAQAQSQSLPVGPPAPAVTKSPPSPPPRPAPKPAPVPAGDGLEVRMFSQAMQAWRAGDAAGALGRIDAYQDLFPRGHFAPEAILVKVDALHALGRSAEVLDFLRSLSLAQLPRSTELQVIRGELSAKAGRCQEALVDLDEVLRHDPGERLGARALYARASCRSRVGDALGAETDLRVYLLRYPTGPQAAAARRALSR
jgi:hypothetical protein